MLTRSLRLVSILQNTPALARSLLTHSLEGLIWGGQSWETSTGRPRGRESFKKVDARGFLGLDASSIAVVYLD